MNSYKQLTLPLRFDHSNRFNNFFDEDSFIVDTLKLKIINADEPIILVSGENSSGKTHLLNASALFCQRNKIPFQYFDSHLLIEHGKDILAEIEKGGVLILDDIHFLARNNLWERQLYDLYNSALRHKWILIVSCLKSEIANFDLNDWSSRMVSGVNLPLKIGNDERLKKVIQFRSLKLGLKINDDVFEYLLKRFNRDLKTQLNLINDLNKLSLEYKKNITIPFVKEALNCL